MRGNREIQRGPLIFEIDGPGLSSFPPLSLSRNADERLAGMEGNGEVLTEGKRQGAAMAWHSCGWSGTRGGELAAAAVAPLTGGDEQHGRGDGVGGDSRPANEGLQAHV